MYEELGNPIVKEFISNMVDSEDRRELFMCGYCWHFAHMLQTTFDRGEVCLCYPFGHFVWIDEDEIPYDAEGIRVGHEETYYIPEKYLKNAIDDFKHIPNISHNTTKKEIEEILNNYLKDNKDKPLIKVM